MAGNILTVLAQLSCWLEQACFYSKTKWVSLLSFRALNDTYNVPGDNLGIFILFVLLVGPWPSIHWTNEKIEWPRVIETSARRFVHNRGDTTVVWKSTWKVESTPNSRIYNGVKQWRPNAKGGWMSNRTEDWKWMSQPNVWIRSKAYLLGCKKMSNIEGMW